MRQRVGQTALAMVIAAVVAGGAVAWACTPSAFLDVAPNRAPAGSVVEVTGTKFANGRVEIRWDSAEGNLLATPNGPAFSISLTVPNAEPGPHYLHAVAYDEAGVVRGQTAAVLQITPSGTTPARPPTAETPEPSPASSEQTAASEHQASVSQPVQAGPEVGSQPRGPGRTPTVAPARTQATPGSAIAAPPRTAAPAGSASAPVPAAPTSAAGATEPDTAPSDVAALARSAAADLWSGFVSDTGRTVVGPGLHHPATSSADDDSARRLGLGFMLLGMAAMATLAAIVIIPRRRAVNTLPR